MTSAFEIREGVEQVDFERTTAWLASTYWMPGVSRERVERAAKHSALVLSVHHAKAGQVAYARLVGDHTTFAWICDVFVDTPYRRQGLARAMVAYCLKHPEHQGLRRFLLATKDAHGVYAAAGFAPLNNPERWMAYHPAQTHRHVGEQPPAPPIT